MLAEKVAFLQKPFSAQRRSVRCATCGTATTGRADLYFDSARVAPDRRRAVEDRMSRSVREFPMSR